MKTTLRLLIALFVPAVVTRQANSPRQIADELVAADRAFAVASARTDGSPDAINLGGPDASTFAIGNQAIGNNVGSGEPPGTSPVSWGPEKTVIAPSGDFGVTIGYIVRNKPGEDGRIPTRQAFFTIWRRDATGTWRYVAE